MTTTAPPSSSSSGFSKYLRDFGWDLLIGSIAAFYAIMVPYTKVEESFNVQAMHDILYHRHHIDKARLTIFISVLNILNYDHLDFPGVVPRTFMGALIFSVLASPLVLLMHAIHLPKIYSLLAVRMMVGCIVLLALRFFRIQTCATIVFRCDTVLLFGPIGIELLLQSKSISISEAIKCCISSALLCIGKLLIIFLLQFLSRFFTVLLDTVMWQRILWPELEVFWFNSVLNRSSEWGTQSFHWYFTSALPRSLLVAYPLCLAGVLLDRRVMQYIVPVFCFVLLYSKLPHKELRFIIGSIPIFNVSAAITASRLYINKKKDGWRWLYIMLLGSFLVSLGCSVMTFIASYYNYPGAYALKALHQADTSNTTKEKFVHIDAFTAMNGVSRFCENEYPWRYSKEEGIALDEYHDRNFTYLLNEHFHIDGYKCLFAVNGFSGARLQVGFPPFLLLKEPKVFVHGNMRGRDIDLFNWPGCP
ncbi:hypothetical protein C4D60_Mb11t00520 [Musa balbisiana]|uniref:Mannosyltransferase n=1 Tax=Musa balbisiana TaxID=52838 RepID=A0A4S8J0T0_MUSBA|nr:hypothetical protein C4D60_Mb11t00520 [Musa balbisiana]